MATELVYVQLVIKAYQPMVKFTTELLDQIATGL